MNRELNNVMEDVAKRVNQQRLRQQQFLAESQRENHPQTSEERLQTDSIIEELPDDIVGPEMDSNVHPQQAQKNKAALPPKKLRNVNAQLPSQVPAATINAPNEHQYAALEAARPAVGTQAKSIAQQATQHRAIEVPSALDMVSGGTLTRSAPRSTMGDASTQSSGSGELVPRARQNAQNSTQHSAIQAPSTSAPGPRGALVPSGPQGVMSNALVQPSGSNRLGPQARRVAQNTMQQRAIEAPLALDMVPGGALVRSAPHNVANDALALTSGIREPIENLNAAGFPQASQSDGRRAARPQRLEAGSSQKQLGAPPLVQPSGTMSQDLVRQGTDLTKRPRR